jgi:hypothetical protein
MCPCEPLPRNAGSWLSAELQQRDPSIGPRRLCGLFWCGARKQSSTGSAVSAAGLRMTTVISSIGARGPAGR